MAEADSLLVNRASMTGMIVFDYAARYGEAVAALTEWMQGGKLVSREDIVQGLDNFPEALLMLFSGENTRGASMLRATLSLAARRRRARRRRGRVAAAAGPPGERRRDPAPIGDGELPDSRLGAASRPGQHRPGDLPVRHVPQGRLPVEGGLALLDGRG